MPPKFEIGETMRAGWAGMKQHFWFWVLILLVAGVIDAIPAGLSSLGVKHPYLAAIFGVLLLLVSIILSMGFIKIITLIVAGEQPDISNLWSEYRKVWKYLLASILYGLLVTAGLILLVVPGIYWGIKYMFYGFAMVDEDLGPIEALKKSAELTYGSKWHIFSFLIVCLGVYILGFLCCLVGLFVAIPVILVATGVVYHSLYRVVVEV